MPGFQLRAGTGSLGGGAGGGQGTENAAEPGARSRSQSLDQNLAAACTAAAARLSFPAPPPPPPPRPPPPRAQPPVVRGTLGVRAEGRSGRRTQLGSRTVQAAADAAAAASSSPQPGVVFRQTREASGADSDFDSDLNPLLLLLAFRCLVLCVVLVCGGFSPVVHFFFNCCARCFYFSFFFPFFSPRERFFGRGFRICFMTVDFTPGGLFPRKTQGTGYLARTSYGFPGASGKWELLQSWRLPSFLSLVLQVGAWSAARRGCCRCRCWRLRLLSGRRASAEPGEVSPHPEPLGGRPPGLIMIWKSS